MKTQEELNALREEIAAMSGKLAELTEEELQQIFSGSGAESRTGICPFCGAEIRWVDNDVQKKRDFFMCPCDGELTYFWEGSRWAKGWFKN